MGNPQPALPQLPASRRALRSGRGAGYTARMNTRLALLLVLSSLALAGCGNKGPLVQAPPESAQEAPASDTTPPTSDTTPPAHDESTPVDADEPAPQPQQEDQPLPADPVIEPVPPGDGGGE